MHDFVKYPEMTNKELSEHPFESPHKQITEDFRAEVVKVHDGDTITLRIDSRDFDFPLRFLGIDAPEMNEGGEDAREWLAGMVLGDFVDVGIDSRNRVDKWGRLLGKVFHRGLDMGAAMLRLGLAVPFGRRKEGELPVLGQMFSLKQWV